ncbi:MAG: ribonuclease Z [Deltaproteobacteria bacterium]|nr:ribonuclease Z [Deltaproteobacteria bacterium]
MISFTVLGSGTCELRVEASSPAYLLEAGDTSLLLDLGQGALRRFLEEGRDPRQLTGVILSHHHLDHLSDLLPLLFALNYDPGLADRTRPLVLAAHPVVGQVLEGLHQVFGNWLDPPAGRLDTRWLEPGQITALGGLMLRTAPAQHIASSLAFRLESGGDGGSLVYLGDSEAAPDLAAFAQGADLLVAHAAAPDGRPKTGHLSPVEAGELAAAAGVGGLLISHLYREMDREAARESAAAAFGGPVWVARDGLCLCLEDDGVGACVRGPGGSRGKFCE